MPNPRAAIPSERIHVAIPADLRARMDLHLYSPAEQRIPYNAQGKLITQLLQEYFNNLDRRPDVQT